MTQIAAIPGLSVWLEVLGDGSIRISAQHLGETPFGDEYEYAFTIAAADLAPLARALGCGTDDIPSAWNAQVQQIAAHGERRWLDAHDVAYTFWSYP